MFHDSSSKSKMDLQAIVLASKIFFCENNFLLMFKKCCRNKIELNFHHCISKFREIYILTWWAPVMAPTSRELFLLGDYFH